MTWMDRIGPTAVTTRIASRTGMRGSGFAMPAGRADAAPGLCAAAAAEAAEMALGGMLALQEAESGSVHDRRARRHGQDMLAELARLQRSLLQGGQDPAALHRLAALADDVPQAADAELRQLVSDVVLRARVELARHETITSG